MLYRKEPEGLIAIAQLAHAWVSGQLAQAWGNEYFGKLEPRKEVCLGAQQHDIGWLSWEKTPTFNPKTGLPHSFTELPRKIHIDIWSKAGELAIAQGRYPALLASLHGTRLYEHYDSSNDSPEDIQLVQDFLGHEQAFQKELIDSLRNDPDYAPYSTPEAIARNRQLVGIWDCLSLILCMKLSKERSVEKVPTAEGEITLKLTPLAGDPTQVAVSPWPFSENAVTLVCEGRYLSETFPDEETMRNAIAKAPWVTIKTHLHPV
ncbi:DUF3891 family protein [Coleofasciculus sp. FACHB-64]|uniref:DUF3891 family protein n=1 Tax=Cyanophyceae TaxID=3028117 RepID=UPI001688FB7A|nr:MULTISPECIES: DUF3891 family protein [unclassified Coleofasciculus]MBD1839663.1 DUF3891 family protein [Coleofasciculus sp. FACHB-501]MBD1896101.1 DUF3891 family protein [Coleofasciculus sp. FACHB-129]MBD2046584.1 DUF3891 family protein [Coleofasciculus sp. FACHB-64]